MPTGLIGLWRLNEETGLLAKDTSIYGNDGTLEGDDPTWVAGKSGNCVNFPGADERVDCGNAYPLNQIGNGSFWLSFWMKSPDVTPNNYGCLFEKQLNATNIFYLSSHGTNNRLNIYFLKGGSGIGNTQFSIASTPFDTEFNHIILVINRTTDLALLYMNTVKDSEEIDISGLPADASNTGNVSWGARSTGIFPYEGLIDEGRIYLGLPSLADIQLLFDHPDGFPGETFVAPESVQLKLISPSTELLGVLSDTDLSGQILNAKITEQKIGGVEKFSFQVPRSIDLPITRNTECYFYVNNLLWKIGYIKEIPKADQDIPVLNVAGEGFYKRLLKKVINVSYDTETLGFIIDDIASTYLDAVVGVFYNETKLEYPVVENIVIEFIDKNLFEVFEKLLEIANYDYSNEKYRFYVDNEKDFVFELLSEDFQSSLFEGHQYQSPEVSVDNSKIVNKILAYRTELADPDVVEYVAAYQDTESQGRFGIFEEKITFPDYIDTTTISKICAFVLEKRSLPANKIKIENFEVQEALNFGKYGIFNRRELYWRIIADCDTLVDWDEFIANTSFAVSTTHVLTGKRSLKFTTAAGSGGEYVEYILPDIIPLPQKVRLFVYFESVTVEFKVTFYDDHGNEITINVGSADEDLLSNQWIRFSEDIQLKTEVDNMVVDPNGAEDDLIITTGGEDYELDVRYEILIDNLIADPNGAEDDFLVNIELAVEDNFDLKYREQSGLLEVKKIRITMLTELPAVFYIDRLDTYCNIYNFHALQLEEIEYNLSSIELSANVNFGKKEDNIFDEIKGQVKEGNIALEIFSKNLA